MIGPNGDEYLLYHAQIAATGHGRARKLMLDRFTWRTQYVFFHECYGELGRMVSKDNEVDDPFTTAAEFRRLAL